MSTPPPPEESETTLSFHARPARTGRSPFQEWLFAGGRYTGTPAEHAHTYPWWKVMCLTGVDYFSTLGYQPGIAFLAAGLISPLATLVLVAVTLFAALPVYSQVAQRSPHGQGSINMLEELLPRWRGKVFVLVLLGFALTDFVITITLSAADAAAHIIENPYVPRFMDHPQLVTLTLLAVLGAIFMRGFREAMGLAVIIVGAYLVLNAVVLIMSVFLIGSSLVTTLFIPAAAFQEGGPANGRALAYLAHELLGGVFGTLYDFSTISILWFAGASAMAGLLTLVPRYLPPYGMAPEWVRGTRALTLVFTAVAFVVTLVFRADVDAQGGAYATGVLFLMSSASVAVTLANWKHRQRRWLYLAMTVVFAYTTAANIVERPEGIKIASFFIAAIVFSSLLSRALRATEVRIDVVSLSATARAFLSEVEPQAIRIIAHRPDKRAEEEYDVKERRAREDHSLEDEPVLFLEVGHGDASEFRNDLLVRGVRIGRHRVLRCKSPAVPNAIAALLIHIHQVTGQLPHAYFGWTEGNPIAYLLRYLFLGEGDTAPVTREVLRKAIANPLDRPRIHVG
jgi:hypothetical protein